MKNIRTHLTWISERVIFETFSISNRRTKGSRIFTIRIAAIKRNQQLASFRAESQIIKSGGKKGRRFCATEAVHDVCERKNDFSPVPTVWFNAIFLLKDLPVVLAVVHR